MAAFDLVAEGGLVGLSLEDVAGRAGVSRQTVYRHFGSRDGLVEALVVREERWFIDRIAAAADRETTAEQAIAAAVTEALQAATEHPLLRRLLETEPGEILPLVVLGEGPVISVGRPAIARILADRLAITDAQANELADVCSRLLVSYVLDPGNQPSDVLGRRIADIVLHGIDSDAGHRG